MSQSQSWCITFRSELEPLKRLEPESELEPSQTAAYLENREGGGARARRAPLHPRRALYGRHWRDFSEGLFVVGGRPNYILHVKHSDSRLEGPEQSQRARRLWRPRGAWPSVPPAYVPGTYQNPVEPLLQCLLVGHRDLHRDRCCNGARYNTGRVVIQTFLHRSSVFFPFSYAFSIAHIEQAKSNVSLSQTKTSAAPSHADE